MQPPNRASSSDRSLKSDGRPFMDEGNHALVGSARNTGEATAILPVVSTLCLGFSAEILLAQSGSAHGAVLILLSLSSVFSLYTTTYSVLEFYYIAMLTASDTKSHYETQDHAGLTADRRDELARQVVEFLHEFEPWRKQARNSLWFSIMLILAAAGAQTVHEQGLSWKSALVCLILVFGVVLVPRTVVKFRRRFVPLLRAYRELHRIEGRGAQNGAVTPELPLVAVF